MDAMTQRTNPMHDNAMDMFQRGTNGSMTAMLKIAQLIATFPENMLEITGQDNRLYHSMARHNAGAPVMNRK